MRSVFCLVLYALPMKWACKEFLLNHKIFAWYAGDFVRTKYNGQFIMGQLGNERFAFAEP